MSQRPRVGISACLLGDRVRYDGRHKRDEWLADVLGPQVEWVPVCPEVEAGFGTPREPMDLVATATGGVALMTAGSGHDLTETMRRYVERRVDDLAQADLDGYVLKAESPSCGIDDVPRRNAATAAVPPEGPGMFAEALIARLPGLPITDEHRLMDARERQAFVARLHAHRRSREHRPVAPAWQPVEVVRVRDGRRAADADRAATEEPLEIRLHGRPFAVIMRTPGADRELAAGFLLAERVITCADDLGTIEYCTDRRDAPTNIVNVTLSNGSSETLERLLADRRQVTTNSSCGLCGRRTIESLATDVKPLRASWRVPASAVTEMPARLRERQAVFDETGGLHAAGLFIVDGGRAPLAAVAEDVGRHNAVDKIVGRMLMREALPLSTHMLCVSGRTSFEIVQKALFAGIPVVAAVSAPSTLAIELAREFGITLIGFLRGDSFTIYAHPDRIVS